ncbi:Dam1p [Kluyveromyces lactis]|uniref:DASH complex subunit DAM1 n=1 Tax=Kluyveromyces lactis (strain ATCC 8585 / CBS 2359 / DSM 70799 / NBRC 1267 / NRRL Y-1140 / WM37) TaxID=284590 RepID=DAM1_KLULA|nr:uncharacterized protein KLLA0_B11429g [Kluyveromyces lactis]Q6CVK1.1 RecName: Full=DASH complex subunit DAM1; AltName: Full=Outer kinetochore protein DAM1 [Kluyveromyces lactis NRRL Y-1140]CAH02431.1 KLLA0B11429p [Kluyveromyces lactis]|eukprot:XP_452038.1 uncharacterized protein KLLA0_B11429g [Kluyveromyces lactis]
MSQRPNTPQRDRPTEYRLSLSSNASSRRSSLGNNGRDQHASNQTMIEKYVLPQLQELSDSMVTLDGNMTHMNFIHESIADLNEALSALLYGLMCNSWCVDFPNISHDTPHELKLIQRLEELKQERQALQAKLKPKELTKGSILPLSRQPLSRGSQMLYRDENVPGSTASSNVNIDINDDEDNTAASFVSNPTTFKPQMISSVGASTDFMGKQTVGSASSKLRRRSILHQIRNNAAIGTIPNTLTGITPGERKRSLAVSAKRIPILAGSSTTAGSASSANRESTNTEPALPNRVVRTRQRTYNPKNLASRPPFR